MNTYERAAVREAVEAMAEAAEKLNQTIKELQQLCDESLAKLEEAKGAAAGEHRV